MTWNGNRQAQAEADAAWKDLCRKREAKAKAAKRIARFKTGPTRPRWLLADGSVDYRAYIQSAAWRNRRERWFARHGRECVECTSTVNVQLHHKNYKRLGRERDSDLDCRCWFACECARCGDKWIEKRFRPMSNNIARIVFTCVKCDPENKQDDARFFDYAGREM